MSRRDLLLAPLFEAALLVIAAGIGWAVHKPLIFASLGPTAYELVETPERKSAQPYNIVVGHLVGVLGGFLALWATDAWHTPPFSSGAIQGPRIWAVALAAAITVVVTLLIKATQPAALSTTLLVALGSMQSWQDGFYLMGGVLIMLICGEPVRLWRLRMKEKQKQAEEAWEKG
ncbi:MAG: HPP family protein [Acidobacteriota bacterium]